MTPRSKATIKAVQGILKERMEEVQFIVDTAYTRKNKMKSAKVKTLIREQDKLQALYDVVGAMAQD